MDRLLSLPIIDAHVHIKDSFIGLEEMFSDMRRAYKASGFKGICFVSDPSAGRLHLHKNLLCMLYKLMYPEDTVYIFAGLDYHIPGTSHENYGFEKQAAVLDEIGVDGFKMYEGKGSARKLTGSIPLDSAAYAGFFRYIAAAGLPVAMHLADPGYFWDVDKCPAGIHNSGWFFGDMTFTPRETVKNEILNVLDRNKGLKMIIPQMGYYLPDYASLEALLHKYTTLYFDIGPTGEFYETVGSHYEATVEFFTKYSKRLVFGCTGVPAPDMKGSPEKAEALYRVLETGEKVNHGKAEARGLSLDESVLGPIYCGNFEDIAGKPRRLNPDKVMEYCNFIKANLERCPGGVPELDRMKARVDEIHEMLSVVTMAK